MIQHGPAEPAHLSPWRRILLATDFSVPAASAIPHAAALARREGSVIVLAHVVEDSTPTVHHHADAHWNEITRTNLASAEEELRRLAAEELPDLLVETVAVVGVPALALVELAEEKDVDVIVLSSHGRGALDRLLAGGTMIKVLAQSPCPVLVVPPARLPRLGRSRRLGAVVPEPLEPPLAFTE